MVGAARLAADPNHLPVMWAQVIDGLKVQSDGRYLDGTFGRGGHAKGILNRLGPEGRLLVMDKDSEAIAVAKQMQRTDSRIICFHGSFAEIEHWNETHGGLDGVLFDLGVSSPQLDQAVRGFSFRLDGPLDMRMDRSRGESAEQWLARATEEEISDVLWQYGEERASRKIAKKIVARRAEQALTRTTQLAELIAGLLGRGDGKTHPATRSFQAIRIFINSELDDIWLGLNAAYQRLNIGGRLVVISFHSLEDRIVKQFIVERAKPPVGNRRMPTNDNFVPSLREIGGKQRADENEIRCNPRSRSAVLRVAEKLL